MKNVFVLVVLFLAFGCIEDKKNGNQNQNAENQKTKKVFPGFSYSGTSLPLENIKPWDFCDLYLTSDAFIFGSIKSIEMTENLFVTVNPRTGGGEIGFEGSVTSLEQCMSTEPALKIDIEVNTFFSNYRPQRPEIVSLYIGASRISDMIPKPIPDFHWTENGPKLQSNNVSWDIEYCDMETSCSLDIGDKIGFFAYYYNYEGRIDIWHLSHLVFWANSLDFNYKSMDINDIYVEIHEKKSLDDIKNGVESCDNYRSEIITRFRSEYEQDKDYIVSSYVLPKCYKE